MAETLDVYLHDRRIGHVTPARSAFGRVTFAVSEAVDGAPDDLTESFALIPGITIDAASASNFFGGYAPEGNHRTALAAKARVDPNDLFGLLKRYALTLAGALSFRTEDPADAELGDYRELSAREVVKKLRTEQREFDLGNEPDSGRSMLPGFQPKLLLARFGDTWMQPLRRAHSTHIVKPAPAGRPAIIRDEFYSHQLARHMGLATFGSEIITYNGHTFLAIQRYDRIVDGEAVRLIHQEDAAQALGIDWMASTSKFQDPERPNAAGRPSALKIAELFGSFGDGSDVETWLRYLLYNVLIGNHDAHAKNVSIIHGHAGPRIADLYDAVPILHINDAPSRIGSKKIGDALSLAIGGEFNHHSVTLDHFRAEVNRWGAVSSRRTDAILASTLDSFAKALDSVAEVDGSSPGLRDRLGYNLDRIGSGKSIGKPKLPIGAWSMTNLR
jgi:serine/threonine-protein kinase HipA